MKRKNTETLLDQIPLNNPTLLKKWTPEQFKAMQKRIAQHFYGKEINTHHGIHNFGYVTFVSLSEIFGLAYTSSSDIAGYWVCNTEVYSPKFTGYKYIGFAMGEDQKGYAVLWDKDENEIILPL